MVWQALYDKAVMIARDVGIEPSMPRQYGRQRNRPNAPAATPFQFWKTNMYLPFVDHLLVELDARLLQGHGRFKAQYLLPTKVCIIDIYDFKITSTSNLHILVSQIVVSVMVKHFMNETDVSQ